ncbi:MAG: FAD-binding oxidoreductase [Legionella sp.]|uniref:FAD-binding oxidoreductase n=1 Tax=Legionella sp. TaxID=459 RepID=UPI0039E55A62
MVTISSWGRLLHAKHQVHFLNCRQQVLPTISQNTAGICYGMGRSYGDVCLNPEGNLWKTRGLDKFISFNTQTGRLVCEAGVLLREIQQIAIPRGWMLPVTPGTQLVTVGGAIANDIHGKNYHLYGSFGNHIHHISLLRTNGEHIECGPEQNEDWFCATVGGLGLTGVIITAEIQLRPINGPWLVTETIPYMHINEFLDLADTSEQDWEHTVSWVDCISRKNNRGIFLRANPAQKQSGGQPKARSFTMAMTPPVSLVNKWSLWLFNQMYFGLKKHKAGKAIVHYEPFLYPLDNVHEWNRMYGPKGFYQYQCVVPRAVGKEAIKELLAEIAIFGEGSFLAVLKTFSKCTSKGMLSFPQEGLTLALDFSNRNEATLSLFARLDAIVCAAKGRIYPAKDIRMSRELFEQGYPQLAKFLLYRDPGISSAMSRRLMGY